MQLLRCDLIHSLRREREGERERERERVRPVLVGSVADSKASTSAQRKNESGRETTAEGGVSGVIRKKYTGAMGSPVSGELAAPRPGARLLP